jgi:DNA primase
MFSRRFTKQSNTKEFYSDEQIASVLRSCDVRVGGEIDTHYLIFCPFHYNVNTPACEIDKTSGLYICFSCGESGSLTDLVMKTTKRNFFEASRVIHSASATTDILSVVNMELSKLPDDQLEEFDSSIILRLHESLLDNQKAIDYFRGRKIYMEAVMEMKLGYSAKQNMVTVPIQDQYGMYVGMVARSIEGKSFKNSTNLPRKHVLFNLNRSKLNDIVVVESTFDSIRLWQLGIPSVATLGSNISGNQILLLNKYANKIMLCPDKDSAGQKMVTKVSEKLTNKQITIMDVGEAKDIGDLSDLEIVTLWKNACSNNEISV